MPSARSLALALLASSAAVSSTDAFSLLSGSRHSHDNHIAEETAAQRFRSAIADRYATMAEVAYGAVPAAVVGKKAAAAATPSIFDDLLKAFDEVTTDVSYTASVAKGTLGSGIYMRQNEDQYLLAMDVAGLHTREIEITAEKGTLRIKGEKKCPKLVATDKPDPLCIPRHYDASFTFPSDADEERADGRLDAGVVQVFVPKLKDQPRGVGRVIKVTGDAADWAYTGSGAKTVVDGTVDGVNSAAERVAQAAQEARDQAAGVYNQAAGTVNRVVDNVVGTVYGAADQAKIAANDASASAKSAGIAATASVKSAGSQVTNAAQRASASAAASASSLSASAAASASSLSASAASAASAASRSATSLASKGSASGAAATASVKSAASAATATETRNPSFAERLKEKIYPTATGSAEGSIHINKEEL